MVMLYTYQPIVLNDEKRMEQLNIKDMEGYYHVQLDRIRENIEAGYFKAPLL